MHILGAITGTRSIDVEGAAEVDTEQDLPLPVPHPGRGVVLMRTPSKELAPNF